MLTTTSEYALRAMVVVTERSASVSVSSTRVARESGVPGKYLSKILAVLVRAGLLNAERGRGGGFRLAKPAGEIRLCEVVAPFEPISPGWGCPLGRMACTDTAPCAAHEKWKAVRVAYDRFLRGTTLAELGMRPGEPAQAPKVRPAARK